MGVQRERLSGIGLRKSQGLGEAHRVLKSVFSLLPGYYQHPAVVRLGLHESQGVLWFADDLCTNAFRASVTIYCKCVIQGWNDDFLENLIKDVDYLRAKR